MALIENNKTQTNTHELVIKVDAETFGKAIDRAFKKNASKIEIPGFRKGKAPKGMIEKYYGEGVFFEDAINDVYPEALSDAVKEAGLEVVVRPEVEVTSVSKADGVEFKAICITKPEVEVENYKGIEVTKTVKNITDEDVDAKIKAMQERNARLVDVEGRAAENGDTVIFDFSGSVDGVPFEGGEAKDFSLVLGSGQFIPGFEDQMIGKNVEEDFDVNVTFPEDYHAEELKGKPAVFKCKIHAIKAKELPVLDDEFAKDVSEFDTLEELKADELAKLNDQAQKAADTDVENKLIDTVIENMKAEIPEQMYEARVDEFVNDFAYRLQAQNLKLDDYLMYTGMTMDSFRKTFREQAEKQVKIRLALEKIVELENIVPSDEDVEAEYAKMAENYKMEVEKIKQFIPAEEFKKDIAVNKAIDLVRDSAVITNA